MEYILTAPPTERAKLVERVRKLQADGKNALRPQRVGAVLEKLASQIGEESRTKDDWTYVKSLDALLVDRTPSSGILPSFFSSDDDDGKRVLTRLKDLYNFDPSTATLRKTSSLVGPTIGTTAIGADTDVGQLIDQNTRMVVKIYTLAGRLDYNKKKPSYDKSNAYMDLVEMFTDISTSAAVVNGFVTDYDYVITPHFVYQVDWFVGKNVAPPGTGKEGTAQYTINELADGDLLDFCAKMQVENPDTYRFNVCVLTSLLLQTLYSLDVAWQVRGLLHYDLHARNIMWRDLDNEKQSPYYNRHWLYTNGVADRKYILPYADHHNVFAEIIDFGRTRSFVPLKNGSKFLLGNCTMAKAGNLVGATEAQTDCSWDMRRLGFDLFFAIDMKKLNTDVILPTLTNPDNAPSFYVIVENRLKQFIVVASNMPAWVNYIINTWKAPAKSHPTMSNQHNDLKVRLQQWLTTVPSSPVRTKVTDMTLDACAALYDAMEPLRAHFDVFTGKLDDETKYLSRMVEKMRDYLCYNDYDVPAKHAGGRDDSVNAEACLALPLFKPYRTVRDIYKPSQTVSVAVLGSQDVTMNPVTGEDYRSPPTPDYTGPTRRDKATSVDACLVCGTHITMDQRVCGALCGHIHTGVIAHVGRL